MKCAASFVATFFQLQHSVLLFSAFNVFSPPRDACTTSKMLVLLVIQISLIRRFTQMRYNFLLNPPSQMMWKKCKISTNENELKLNFRMVSPNVFNWSQRSAIIPITWPCNFHKFQQKINNKYEMAKTQTALNLNVDRRLFSSQVICVSFGSSAGCSGQKQNAGAQIEIHA